MKKIKEDPAQTLSNLRAMLAEDEAYRATLPEGYQASQVDSKIRLWKRRIAEILGTDSATKEGT